MLTRGALALLIIATSLAADHPTGAPPLADDTLAKKPPPLEVTVEEHLGASLETLKFVDEQGKPIDLKSLTDGKHPIIIAPVYYNCPHLCTLTLNGVLQAIERERSLKLGRDFKVVAYSFHPDEKSGLAQLKQANYLRRLSAVTDENLKEYSNHWRFFTGSIDNIALASRSIGFKYLKETSTNPKKADSEYVHPAVIVVVTPDLKISRYLYGVEHTETDFKLSLIEASNGKITQSLSDIVMMTCYSFDPVKRKYSLVAWRVMRLGAIGAGVVLVLLLIALWYREKNKRPA